MTRLPDAVRYRFSFSAGRWGRGATSIMGQQFLIKAGAVLAAAFILAACGDDQPATDTSNAGDSSATTTAPASNNTATAAPAGPAPGTQEHFILKVGDRVFFATDKHNLDADAQGILRRQPPIWPRTRMLRSPSKAMPTNAAPGNTTWVWVIAAQRPRVTILSALVSVPIACAPFPMARNARLRSAATRMPGPRTAVRLPSSATDRQHRV